jgi:transcriptional antiterminator RfaH
MSPVENTGNVNNTIPKHLSWFAVQVTPGKEKQVSDNLQMKGYKCLLPIQQTRRHTSYGVKEVKAPLFAGYLFCLLDLADNRMPMLTTPHVRNLVSFGGKPTPLRETEVKIIQRVVDTGVVAQSWPYLREGNPVELVSGPLAGLRGLLVSVKEDSHLVVAIEMLQRSIAVKIHPECVSLPLEKGCSQMLSSRPRA